MTNVTELSLAELTAALKGKKVSAVEVVDAYLERVGAAGELNAYITVGAEQAREMAKASDKRIAEGQAGVLEGVPLGVKDLFCTEGVMTTAGSRILDGFKPVYESTVTSNLWRDGAVMLGKLNLDEFAMGSSNETSYYGPVVNPWRRRGSDAKLTPGGSSGGSSAAVAAHLCAGATGTDTGGSIRQPASLTGTVGVKPTYGRCSRWGIVAFASSLDQAGPIARDVRDAAIMLRSMAGHDLKDSTSVDRPVPNYEEALGKSLKGMKIGVPREYRIEGLSDEIQSLWSKGVDWLKDAGCEVVDISLPMTKYALPVYYIVAPAEASSNLARYDGVKYGHRAKEYSDIISMYEQTRAEGFGDEVKRRILIGTYVLSAGYYDAYYLRAQKVRKMIYDEFVAAFQECDLILSPSTPSSAFGLGEKSGDPVQMYLNDVFTVTANLAGIPGASVPAGLDEQGLPLGLQLLARPFDEETLFHGDVRHRASGRIQGAPNRLVGVTRSFFDFNYLVPLDPPIESDAYIAPDEGGDWRLIIFPGTPSNKLLFSRFLRTAPAGVEIIVITRPGFGQGHNQPFTSFDDQVAAIRPFLDGTWEPPAHIHPWGKKKVITMGVSYGGELALKAALDYPDQVRGVVTVAALIDEPHDYARHLEELGGNERVQYFVPNRWQKVREEVVGRRSQIGPLLENLRKLQAPVEVLHGDFDGIVPKSNAEKLMAHLGPNANCEIIPGGTHYLELQYPRRIHQAVARVIERANVHAWREGDQTAG